MLPPPYGDNNDLPTYEEVERIKIEEEARVSQIQRSYYYKKYECPTLAVTHRTIDPIDHTSFQINWNKCF